MSGTTEPVDLTRDMLVEDDTKRGLRHAAFIVSQRKTGRIEVIVRGLGWLYVLVVLLVGVALGLLIAIPLSGAA